MDSTRLTVSTLDALFAPGDERLQQCHAAIGHLRELPASTPQRRYQAEAELAERRAAAAKAFRLQATIVIALCAFFIAFLVREAPAPHAFAIALLPALALTFGAKRYFSRLWDENHRRLVDRFEPLTPDGEKRLAQVAVRWPETRDMLRRWQAEQRPLTEQERTALQRFDNARRALQDALEARWVLRSASTEPEADPGAPAAIQLVAHQTTAGDGAVVAHQVKTLIVNNNYPGPPSPP